MMRRGSMVLAYSDERETGALTSQTITTPLFVPAARNRARWPGMSAGDAGWLATDIGDAYGEDAVEAVEKPSAGSSESVSVANVEESSADTVRRVFLKPPKLNLEDRHSSTRLARSGELLDDMYEELRLRNGA